MTLALIIYIVVALVLIAFVNMFVRKRNKKQASRKLEQRQARYNRNQTSKFKASDLDKQPSRSSEEKMTEQQSDEQHHTESVENLKPLSENDSDNRETGSENLRIQMKQKMKT